MLPLRVFCIKPFGNTLPLTDADVRTSIGREKQAGNNGKQVKTSSRTNNQKEVELAIDFWRNHEILNEEGIKEQRVTVTLCLKRRKKEPQGLL